MAKQIIFEPQLDILAARVVDIITDAVNEVLLKKDKVILALPGGRSIQSIFKLLIKDRRMPWSQVEIFLVDERLVDINHPDSNYGGLREHLTGVLTAVGAIPDIRIHPFIYQPEKKDLGTKDYQKELQAYGGRYDIVVLGVGEDGHVGALYPNHHSIKDNSEFYLTMDDSPKPPVQRMTSSLGLLLKAKYGLVLFFDEAKRQAYQNYLNPDLGIADCPAKLIDEITNSYVITNLK